MKCTGNLIFNLKAANIYINIFKCTMLIIKMIMMIISDNDDDDDDDNDNDNNDDNNHNDNDNNNNDNIDNNKMMIYRIKNLWLK